jgi:hypothetical protein
VEIHSEARIEFLTWPDEAVPSVLTVGVELDITNGATFHFIGLDGASTLSNGVATHHPSFAGVVMAIACQKVWNLSEGYHFLTVVGSVNTGTGTWRNGEVSLGAHVRG